MAKAWYVVHTYSGFENKAKLALEERIRQHSLGERFGQVLIPTEEVVEHKNGQKKSSTRKFFPGYILVEMELDNQTWSLVKDTPRITGFVGGEFGRKPIRMPDEEVARITRRIAGEEAPPKRVVTNFEKNEEVRVIEGPLAPIIGKVDLVNSERGRLRVIVNIFGRPTPVDLEFHQVEKVS